MGDLVMSKKIICESCGAILPFDKVKDMSACPVCNALFDDEEESVDKSETQVGEEHPDWITWYYYGYKSDNGKTALLEDEPINLAEYGDKFFLIKEFKAPPESECGLDEVKRILRTYVPDAFNEPKKTESTICCPWCGSSEFTLLNRGYSLLTGFLGSGKVKRVCNKCKREF